VTTASTIPSEIRILHDGGCQGVLRAIEDSTDEIATWLTRWRTRSSEWFLTRFTPSIEGTRHWLANVVIPDRSRRLYVVHDDTDKPIGTVGLLHLDRDPVELDNILRGEPTSRRELMSWALDSLIEAVRTARPRVGFHLFVLSNNRRAIGLYERLGFGITGRFTLSPRTTPSGHVLEKGEAYATSTLPDELHLLEMSLS